MEVALYCVYTAILVSRLMYARPAFLGFASDSDLHQTQSVLGRAALWGLTGNRSLPSLADYATLSDKTLFRSDLSDLLRQFLSPPRQYPYKQPSRLCSQFLTSHFQHPQPAQSLPQNAIQRCFLNPSPVFLISYNCILLFLFS